MHLASTMAVAALGLGLTVGAAQAAPSAMLQSAVDTGPAPQITLVRGGCGWGAHRSWYGRCHYNHGWRGRSRWRRRHWY